MGVRVRMQTRARKRRVRRDSGGGAREYKSGEERTVLDRDFRRDVPSTHYSKRGAARVPDDRAKRDNVYVLKVVMAGG